MISSYVTLSRVYNKLAICIPLGVQIVNDLSLVSMAEAPGEVQLCFESIIASTHFIASWDGLPEVVHLLI